MTLAFLEQNPKYRQMSHYWSALAEPSAIQFRVVWADGRNQIQVNRAWRVQFSLPSARTKAVCASIRQLTFSILKFSALNKPSKIP